VAVKSPDIRQKLFKLIAVRIAQRKRMAT